MEGEAEDEGGDGGNEKTGADPIEGAQAGEECWVCGRDRRRGQEDGDDEHAEEDDGYLNVRLKSLG